MGPEPVGPDEAKITARQGLRVGEGKSELWRAGKPDNIWVGGEPGNHPKKKEERRRGRWNCMCVFCDKPILP